MEETKAPSTAGIGFGGALALLFIALKLTGFIDWSWWWVLAPIWAPLVIGVALISAIFAVGLFAETLKPSAKRR